MPRSSVIATSSRNPEIASVHSDGTPRTFRAELIVCSRSAPSAAPITLPLPAEDRHAADHHGGDDLKLEPGRGGGVDRVVLGSPQHPAEPGERATEHERSEDSAADRDASEPGGVGIRPDRVQLAARAIGAQVVSG